MFHESASANAATAGSSGFQWRNESVSSATGIAT